MPTPSRVRILGGGTAGSGPVKWSSKALLAGVEPGCLHPGPLHPVDVPWVHGDH